MVKKKNKRKSVGKWVLREKKEHTTCHQTKTSNQQIHRHGCNQVIDAVLYIF